MSEKHIKILADDPYRRDTQEWNYDHNEYSITWKNVIFIPFNRLWQYVVMSSVIINALYVIYDITYNKEGVEFGADALIYYTAWLLYFIDTALSIAHKNMSAYREVQAQNPKSTHRLALDAISLIPFYEMYVLVKAASRIHTNEKSIKNIFRIQSLIRIHPVFTHLLFSFSEINTYDIITSITVSHHLKLVLLGHIIAALWYSQGCWNCDIPNWTDSLNEFDFNKNNSAQWFIVSYCTVANTLINNWGGYNCGITIVERLITLTTMLLGFILHYLTYLGMLLIAYLKVHKKQLTWSENFKDIQKYLVYSKVNKEWCDKTIAYYKYLWKERSGIKDMPKTFRRLPMQLQKEVTVDIYWEAFKHSHLFCGQSLAFKRDLSLQMKNEFFVPGDYVYKVREVKDKMIYIVSGILQVLAQEDEESPIMSFSSGTVLGETSCFCPSKSVVNVRCATYCELHTLTIYDLYKVLKNYPKETKILQETILNRVQNAMYVKDFVTSKPNMAIIKKEDTCIKFIKRQWRELFKLNNATLTTVPVSILTSPYHTSEFLNLIVLSKDIELKTRAICLRGSCPFVFTTKSSFRAFLSYLVLISVLLQCIIVPYYITFYKEIPDYIYPVCFILDMVYVFHIYLELSTAIKKHNRLIASSSGIAMEKTRQISFMIDIMATIPLDYFGYLMEALPYTCALLKLNRLMRFYAVHNLFYILERSVWYNILLVKIAKYVVLNVIIAYWIACITNLASTPTTLHATNPTASNSSISIYYSLSQYLSMPMGYLLRNTPLELVSYHFIKLLSYYVFTMCLAQICSIYIERLHKYKNYKYFLFNMNNFLKTNKIGGRIKNQACEIIYFWWYLNKHREAIGKHGILIDASSEIQKHVFKNRLIACVEGVPLFANLDREVIDCIINNCLIKTLPAGVEITKCGKRTSSIYFILQGYCEMHSEMAGDIQRNTATVLSAGMAFPIVEVLHEVECLTTIVTTTAVEMMCLKMHRLNEIINSNVEFKTNLNEALKKHYREYNQLLYLDNSRLPPMVPIERSLGKSNMFKYKVNDDDSKEKELEYQKPFNQLGKWSIIKYTLLRKTIDPSSQTYVWYECFRCLMILIRLILVFIHFNVLINYVVVVEYVYSISNALTMIDMYIRMHCQYHTKNGILVTHPWYTAKHYIKTSFGVDAITMMPLRSIKFDQIMGYRRKEMVFCFLSLITKPWQLYRVFGLINYVTSKVEGTSQYLHTLKYVILVLVLICSFALAIKIHTCKIEETQIGVKLTCNKSSWLYHNLHEIHMTPSVVYLKCLYATVIFFTTSTCGSLTTTEYKEIVVFTTIAVLAFALRVFVYAKTISYKTGGNVTLTLYQERVNIFLRFIQNEYVDDDLIKETISYYQYIWDKTQGSDFKPIFDEFNTVLHKDLLQSIYQSTLQSVKILENIEPSFLRDILIETKTVHFKKDTQIIRCNDIQDLIFIVHTGTVDIRIAKTTICTLGTGGIFGCFGRTGMTRQTIEATAQVHVTVLTIDSATFHRIGQKYPNVKKKLLKKTTLHFEYEQGLVQPSLTKQIEKDFFIDAISARNHILINENLLWYQWWKYIVYVHVASISSLCLMVFIVILRLTRELTATAKIVIYLLDVIFCIKIFLEFHLCYEDADSGILISDFNLIRKKYTKSLQIWIDVFTCFPFDVFASFVTTNQTIIKYCIFNRIFRFIHLIQYYNDCHEKLYVKSHLQRTYLFYWFCISLQLMTCVWWLTACPDQRCYYANSTSTTKEYVAAEPGIESIMYAYTYIVNLFTTTGYMDCAPLTKLEIIVSILILFVFQMSTIALISQFTSLLEIRQYSHNNYEHQIKLLDKYLNQQQLSAAITKKVWTYNCKLWTLHGGVSIPEMIINAPPSLKQDLMKSLYGYHVSNHFLFKDTHVDFLRQLVVHLKRCLFFPQNYLVTKDDIDGSMYFIHQGTVEVHDVRGDKTKLLQLLDENDTFGEEQLLYNTRHKQSYKARTVVDVVILNRTEWSYLLQWFPASRAEIFKKAREYCITSQD